MVFGFFSRKPVAPVETAIEAGPLTDSISPQFKFPLPTQLHTPSPSVDSTAQPVLPKPKSKPRSRPKPKPKSLEPRHASPDIVPPNTPSPPPEDSIVTDPTTLHTLISSVPAQTLHAYTLAHLCPVPPSPFLFSAAPTAPPTPTTLTALTTFFASLTPPPKLHCVRCHRGYFELENTDTACRVPHDDDSAIVERVGLTKGADAGYETLWGCCAKTVEGDGDMGPPDGWCYEGAHTIDIKRARFRADSTLHDDKLTSCLALRCHMPPFPPPTRSSRPSASRKRSRRATETNGDGDEHEDDMRSVESSQHTRSHSHNTHSRSISGMSKGKVQPLDKGQAEENGEEEGSKPRPAKRLRARKPSTPILAPLHNKEEGEEEQRRNPLQHDTDADAMDLDDIDIDLPPPPPISPPKSPPKRKSRSTTAKAPSCPNPRSPPSSAKKAHFSRNANTSPQRKSPLSKGSFTAGEEDEDRVVVVHARSSPVPISRTPMKRVEVEIVSQSPPKSKPGSLKSLNRTGSPGSLRKTQTQTKATKGLGEIVDTSVDGEGWPNV